MEPFARVLLARHGQTEWNLAGRGQGRADSPLTEAGLAQARRHAEKLRTQPVDLICTSPLGRARTTAKIIAEAVGVPVHVLPELHHGDFTGLTSAQVAARAPERARDKYHWRFPNGESYADADQRAAEALRAIARHTDRPLIVSHEMIGRVLVRNLLGEPPAAALARDQPHGVGYEVVDGTLS
ncbi:histidine phosphatase family protein [Actinophytocola sp. KF-1]